MEDATHYHATFTANDGIEDGGSVPLEAANFAGGALNGTAAPTPDTVTIDTKNPTVTVDIVDTSLSDTDNSSLVNFTFSEAPGASFTLADISRSEERRVGKVIDDATPYHATFTANDGIEDVGSVTVDAAKFTDAALNDNVSATPDSVTIDTKNPTVTVDIVDTSLSDTDNSSLVNFTFSEAPGASFTLADIS